MTILKFLLNSKQNYAFIITLGFYAKIYNSDLSVAKVSHCKGSLCLDGAVKSPLASFKFSQKVRCYFAYLSCFVLLKTKKNSEKAINELCIFTLYGINRGNLACLSQFSNHS